MTHLPMRDRLLVQEGKLLDYLLNEDHSDGAAKARFFVGGGFSKGRWWELADALVTHGVTQPVVAEFITDYGIKYQVECNLVTPDGRNPCITSIWIAESSAPPRLVTAYPNS